MDDINITINTSKGDINITLFPDDAPVTVTSFLNLASNGYYDGLNFHRVIPNFMVQGGCPTGTGTGGPGYKFECECKAHRRHDKPGILSMANAGPNSNGSQSGFQKTPDYKIAIFIIKILEQVHSAYSKLCVISIPHKNNIRFAKYT